MWIHAMDWHWLGSLAVTLFWVLIITLALAPINYLRAQLEAQENSDAEQRETGAQGRSDEQNRSVVHSRHQSVMTR